MATLPRSAFRASAQWKVKKTMAACASLGILLGASYFLWTMQRMFFGKVNLKGGLVWQTALTDLNLREKITLLPLAVITLAIGLWPSLVFSKINDSVLAFVQFLHLK